eukprot:1810728-Lingulodinium_polyedra.AAC.1
MASTHSWERPRHAWEQAQPEPAGGPEAWGDASDEDELPDGGPAEEFVSMMLDLLLIRTLSAKQFCILMHFAGKAGIAQAT